MRHHFALALVALASAWPANAMVIETGSYSPGLTSGSGDVTLGPGRYRFDFRFSAPVLFLDGGPEKITTTNFFCVDPEIAPGEFPCGGDNVFIQPLFEGVTPILWSASLTVDTPEQITFEPGNFLVRAEVFDECCTYTYAFESETSGRFVFSVSEVPEPSSWALMIVAFGFAGSAWRRRKSYQPMTR